MSLVDSELVQEPGELADVPQVDVGDLLDPVRPVLVMGQVVMALGDADLVERAVAAVVGEQQGRHSRRVGLERQDQHVEHELDVLRVVRRDARAAFRRPGRGHRRTARPSRSASRSRGRRSGTGRAFPGPGSRAAAASSARLRGQSRGWIAAPAGGVAGSPAAGPARRRRRGVRRQAAGWTPAASASSANSRRGCTGRRRNSPNRRRRTSGPRRRPVPATGTA